MRITFLLACFAAVAAVPIPKPGFVMDVADQIFPTFKAEVQDAVLDSVDAITKVVQSDTADFLKSELSGIYFLPTSVVEKIRGFLMNRIVSQIGAIISESIKMRLPKTVDAVFVVLKSEIYRIDNGVDHLALDYRNHIREVFRLPPARLSRSK